MLILKHEELAAMQNLTKKLSNITIKGREFSLGPTFSLQMRDVAINFCKQEEDQGNHCLLVESNTTITVWKEVKTIDSETSSQPPQFNKQKFIEYCEQELIKRIGPMGHVIIAELISSPENFSPSQFVKKIIAEIPDPELAEEFKDCVFKKKM